MFNSTALDILIGLFTFFFVISTLSSAVYEVVASLLRLRARTLQLFLEEQFVNNLEDLKKLYASLGADAAREFKDAGTNKRHLWRTLPSNYGKKGLTSVNSNSFVYALYHAIRANPQPGQLEGTYKQMNDAVAAMQEGPIKNALTIAMAEFKDDLNKITNRMETWFDGQMERLTDIYKRQAQLWLFIIGLTIALLLNLDAIVITNALSNNPAVRAMLVDKAARIVENREPGQPPEDIDLEPILAELASLGLPLTWACANDPNVIDDADLYPGRCDWQAEGQLLNMNWSKIIGLLISAGAVSLGAPFWFDLLKIFTRRPSKSDEKSTS